MKHMKRWRAKEWLRSVEIPAIESHDVGGGGVSLYPPIFTDRTDTSQRVQNFAESWQELLADREVSGFGLKILRARGMLL